MKRALHRGREAGSAIRTGSELSMLRGRTFQPRIPERDYG
jgi:hypothetical protein